MLQKQSPGVFYKKGVLKNFTKPSAKHLCQRLFFNKVAGLQVFSCKIGEIFKNTLFTEHLRRTASDTQLFFLLNMQKINEEAGAYYISTCYFCFYLALYLPIIFVLLYQEAATRSVLLKKVFLETSQNSQENTCARASFLMKLQA